jgi:TetR/AcrR family transcriptional regulator
MTSSVRRQKRRRGKYERTEARNTRSRAAILAAAERLFAAQGLDGTRTGAIAEAAGVNKALLYYYFRSKEALYAAVLESHISDFCERSMKTLEARKPARDLILAHVGMSCDFVADHPYFALLIQRLSMSGGRTLERLARRYSAPVGEHLAAVVRRGIRSGEFRSVDPWHMVISLAALTRFYFVAAPLVKVVMKSDPYARANIRRHRKEVLDFIRFGLFRNPEGEP